MTPLTDAIRWLEVRLNRPLLPGLPDHSFWSLYQSSGVTLDEAPRSLEAAAAGPTDLMIALTTYNRPDSCERMLVAMPAVIANSERALRYHLVVVKDGGGAEYGPVVTAARARFGDDLTWLDARAPLGKREYWKTYQTLFQAARLLQPAHALFLQDDLELAPTLLRAAYDRFDALEHDARHRVLSLFSTDDDEPEGRWIHFRRREVLPGVRLTRWFDLPAFFTDRALLELLRYRVFPVSERRWKKKPYSSGVGEQLTRRLFRRANVYQTVPSLALHGAHPSEMNPEARADRALDNRSLGGAPES